MKIRLAARVAAQRGWRVRRVVGALVIVEGRTARRRIAEHAVLFGRFDTRGRAAYAFVRDPRRPADGLLAFVDGTRRAGTTRMSSNDIHGIESGWKVKTADGNDIGSVEETTDTYILVKSGLITTTQRYLPAVTLAHVRPEMKEVGISLTSEAVEAGDWSEPPLEGPRTENAPLNDDDYEELDPVAAGTVRDPEKPTSI